MKIITYMKPSCGWSNGVRSIMRKYDLSFEYFDIIIDGFHRLDLIQQTGQMMQPCVEVDGKMLVDVSGDEVEAYLLANNLVAVASDPADGPTDAPCAHEVDETSIDFLSREVFE